MSTSVETKVVQESINIEAGDNRFEIEQIKERKLEMQALKFSKVQREVTRSL